MIIYVFNKYLYSTDYVQGTLLSIPWILIHLDLIAIPQDG